MLREPRQRSPERAHGGGPPVRVPGVLLLHHLPIRPGYRNASTIREHLASFGRLSEFPVTPVNVAAGLPSALRRWEFDAVVMHYSIFGMGHYWFDQAWLDWLAGVAGYKVAFFQDEHFACERRFRFIDEYSIDCVFSCLESPDLERVYGEHTNASRLESNLPGYVSEESVRAAERFALPHSERPVDVAYRGRPLAAYMGRGAQEKHLIGERFRERAADSGLVLDIAGREADRLYGDDWYRFNGRTRCVLGVESGVSAFDIEGEVYAEYLELSARGEPTVEELETLDRWEDVIHYRTASPRHFEAAAFRCTQILFEGAYSGVLEPGRHYVPLAKDFSNLDSVLDFVRDREACLEMADRTRTEIIDSGQWGYDRMVGALDGVLHDAGLRPGIAESALTPVRSELRREGRRGHARRWTVELWRRVAGSVFGTPAGQRVLRTLHPVTSLARRILGRPATSPYR